MKYDTVIGTIGKTHGVSSDNAPAVAASQMNAAEIPGVAVTVAANPQKT
jgi:hypothetical protein